MAMHVISGRSSASASSTLNPNAPMFVPLAYRTVEDFSDEWWALVQSSPWFRDYWLQERFCDPQTDPAFLDFYDPVLADLDSLFDVEDEDSSDVVSSETDESNYPKDVVRLGSEKWRKGRVSAESPRFIEKAPKIVKVKLSPRTIQQPR